jgi:hypothetical protein
MSIEQVESAIQALPQAERWKLARWFDDHRHEFLLAQTEVEDAQRQEVLARLAESDASPEKLDPFGEEDFDKMIQEFAHARAKKTSAGQD